MQIAVLGPLVLLANFGLADDDGELDADLGRGGTVKVKFEDLDELRHRVEQARVPGQVEEPAEDLAEVAAETRGDLREADDTFHAARLAAVPRARIGRRRNASVTQSVTTSE
jgi:hypothetical protein